MLKTIRIVGAASVFVGLNLFFFGFADGAGLAQVQFVPACLAFNVVVLGVVAGVTLLAGRPVVRAVAAVLFAVLLLCGAASLAGLVEPYSVYGRFATHLFEPLAAACNNYVADLCMRWGRPCMLKSEIFIRGWSALAVAGVSLAALTVVAALRGRLFCNTVCPVGAVLGLLSVKAPVRIRLDAAKCVKCGLCAKACKAECIDVANGKVDQSRCVRCFTCIGTCKKGALSWK